MNKESLQVSRRYAATPWELTKANGGQVRTWHQTLSPFVKAVGYGLFAATDEKDPAGWQEIKAGQLLEIIEVAKHPTAAGRSIFHAQHYRDAYEALTTLFNVAVPISTQTVKKVGREYKVERRIGYVRLLQGFQLVYRTESGGLVDLSNPAYSDMRVDVSNRYRGDRRRSRTCRPDNLGRPVYAMPLVDEHGQVLTDDDGTPRIRPPSAYLFRWGTDIIEDLTDSRKKGKGHGWLKMTRDLFRVCQQLRKDNQATAFHLMELVVSDIIAEGPTRQTLIKPAKLIFKALGFPEPGSIAKCRRWRKDGRWSENVKRVAAAVAALKELEVLLPESDERPQEHLTRGWCYRWERASKWTFTEAIEIGAKPQSTEKAPSPALQGQDIQQARKAAGLTLKEFARRFGRSESFWSHVESERIRPETGEPRAVPAEVVETVMAFVVEHLEAEGLAET